MKKGALETTLKSIFEELQNQADSLPLDMVRSIRVRCTSLLPFLNHCRLMRRGLSTIRNCKKIWDTGKHMKLMALLDAAELCLTNLRSSKNSLSEAEIVEELQICRLRVCEFLLGFHPNTTTNDKDSQPWTAERIEAAMAEEIQATIKDERHLTK